MKPPATPTDSALRASRNLNEVSHVADEETAPGGLGRAPGQPTPSRRCVIRGPYSEASRNRGPSRPVSIPCVRPRWTQRICGKSTVLFSCACAYRVPGRGPREFTPTSLFPNFTNQQPGDLSDPVRQTELEFHYVYGGDRLSMVWRRRKSWNRSYMGRKGGMQPEREVYLRTLANLTNPSEVRGILQLGRKEFETRSLSPELLIFAHRILPWRYRDLV